MPQSPQLGSHLTAVSPSDAMPPYTGVVASADGERAHHHHSGPLSRKQRKAELRSAAVARQAAAALRSRRAEREREGEAGWDGAFDDDLGIDDDDEHNRVLITQQSHLQAWRRHAGRVSPSPPSTPPAAVIAPPPERHSSTQNLRLATLNASQLSPLAASLFAVAKQLTIAAQLQSSAASAQTTGGSSSSSSGSTATGEEHCRPLQSEAEEKQRLQLHDVGSSASASAGCRVTFMTAVDAVEPLPWSQQPDLSQAIAALPSLIHSSPALPPAVSLPRLLSLCTSTSFLPPSLLPLLTSPPSLQLLQHAFFLCLLLLGDVEDDLKRHESWEQANKRRKALAERRAAAAAAAAAQGSRGAAAAGERRDKRREKGREKKDAVIRYTRYGEDEQEEEKEETTVQQQSQQQAAAAEDEELSEMKSEGAELEPLPPFRPSRPPLLGPSPLFASSASPSPSSFSSLLSCHPHSASLGPLLDRLSSAYLALFQSPPVSRLDLLLSAYPDIASECLYHCYVSCLPLCVRQFDTEFFRRRLLQLVNWLLLGYAPCCSGCSHWRIGGAAGEERRSSQLRRTGATTLPTVRLRQRERASGQQGLLLLERRRVDILHSPLVAHLLQRADRQSASVSLSLSLPLSFPIELSPALQSALSITAPPPDAALRAKRREFEAMQAALRSEERRDWLDSDKRGREEEAERVQAMQRREQYAAELVRGCQHSKYRSLKQQSKHLALHRLTQLQAV